VNRPRNANASPQAADCDSPAHEQLQLFSAPREEKDDFPCGDASGSSGGGEPMRDVHEGSPSSVSSSRPEAAQT
jgi:hypothetical protein